MKDVVSAAVAAVAGHAAVRGVEFAGSRSRGTHDELSDWDFAIDTADFPAVARDMPALVSSLDPVAEQWEPLGHFPVYQVMLQGPIKVEYLFLDHSQETSPPVVPSPDTLAAIDTHFWDWTWWLASKEHAGRGDLVAEHLAQMQGHLLAPLGVDEVPESIEAAIAAYVARRDALEEGYGVTVPRALEEEVRRGVQRIRR
jgi:hypothetical protein